MNDEKNKTIDPKDKQNLETETATVAEPTPETPAVPVPPVQDSEVPDIATAFQQELAAEKERHLRTLAEYDNFRKRSAKERETIYQDVRADAILKFLPVYDNLVRALAQSTEDEAYRKGVEMIMSQMESVLEGFGVKAIPALGEIFDPNIHNAVMHVEDENAGEGIIVEEFQRGFLLGDKVIRFSMVKVAN